MGAGSASAGTFVCRLSSGVFVSNARNSLLCERRIVITSITWTVTGWSGTTLVDPSTTAFVTGPDGNWFV